jgi:hypothetical protein
MTNLRPLKNTVLFQFLDDTGGAKGRFSERYNGSIVIPVLNSNQNKSSRWGKVVSIGPEVQEVKVGDFILIEPLQWTNNEVFEGEKIWKTDEGKIMLSTDDESQTYNF